MRFKDITTILFFPLMVILISGCVPDSDVAEPTRIIIGANIQGKIYEGSSRNPSANFGLARLGGFVDEQRKKRPIPTVLIQLGNSVTIENEKHLKTAELIAKGAQMIGFGANLSSTYEFNDTVEFARKRSETGWKQVVSNLEPKVGVTPPVMFEKFHCADPGNGKFVYFYNFISQKVYYDHKLLYENYEWTDPTDEFKDLARKIRARDIVVVYYQTDKKVHLKDLYSIQEAEQISCLILDLKLFNRLQRGRPEKIKDANIIRVPVDNSSIESVEISRARHINEWKMNAQRLMLSASYSKNLNVEKLLQESQPQ